jgi:hypothetical protein
VFQREVREALQGVKRDPLTSFSVRKDVSIATTDTKVAHGMGKIPSGWMLTDKTANAVVWRVAWDDEFVTFRASAAVTVSVRFF